MIDNNPLLKRRRARVIPFGYKVHPDNDKYLVPIPIELEGLKKAKEYHDQGYPYRSIREWLIKATGRNISLVGLFKILRKMK